MTCAFRKYQSSISRSTRRLAVLRAATYGRGVFEFMMPAGPAIAVGLEDGLAFGTVCSGPHYLTLTVSNVGTADLAISNVERLVGSADVTVLPTPATPLIIAPGEDIDFIVVYTPSQSGRPGDGDRPGHQQRSRSAVRRPHRHRHPGHRLARDGDR